MDNSGNELTGLEIAIVGMACKLPGANSLEEYWGNLCQGLESIHTFTREELEELGDSRYDEPGFVNAARLIDEPDKFDAAFFGSSPREAEILDPQKRLFLECCWQALENAGYDSDSYEGLIGVYAGEKMSAYLVNLYSRPDVIARIGDFQMQIANDKDYLATRIAYKLALGGPSVTVQTACSTSLVATHLGCQTLLSGEADMILAGGVSVRADMVGYTYREGEIYSRDGRIRAFDADATGTIFGNGLGVVVLKRLEDALADGDNIRAVIKGSAVNNDSNIKVGYAAPGADGQARVIRAAQTVAEIDPSTITYVETHGTGTATGDPIEVSALTRAFRETTEEKQFCALASVKSNIGHLGAAAGVAGLIKTVLCLENRKLPPSINFENPNPQIDFENSPFYVNTELKDWEPANGAPLRAGMSAFGIGGTNAHAVLEEAPALEPTGPSRRLQLLPVSTRTDTAIETAVENLARHLESHPEENLADVAFTLKVGRRAFEHRRFVVAKDGDDAVAALRDPKRLLGMVADGRRRPVAFMFSGQGSQYPGMGQGLYESEPVFRDTVDHCCEILKPHLDGRDLRQLMYPEDPSSEAVAEELAETRFTQPALFVVEYATAQLWKSWGIEPDAMIGHSIGEYAAACMAGVMTVDEALPLVAARGRLMQSLPAGDMLSVPLSEEEIVPHLGPQLSIAALNAPGRSVVSGPSEAIQALSDKLEEQKVRCRPLVTSHAFHSGMMEPILQPFIEEVSKIELRAPQIPYVSNVTGNWITEAEATDPSYYAVHLRQAVRFAEGVARLLEDPNRVLLEVGPGNTLTTLSKRHPDKGADHVFVSSITHPKSKDADALEFALSTLGQLWLAGVKVDWKAYIGDENRRRVQLPTYPFERRRFWISGGDFGADAAASGARRKDLADWFELPTWKPSLVPALPAALDAEAEPETWLLFADAEGLADRLAARLAELGRPVVTVTPGEAGLRAMGDDAYELAPGDREGVDALFKQLIEAGKPPRRVVHLWNVNRQRREGETAQDFAFFSFLWLAQALGKRPGKVATHLLAVTSDMHRLGSDAMDTRQPEKASLLGPIQVMGQEAPFVHSMALDISLANGIDDPAFDEMVDAVLAEAAAGQGGTVAAYRDGERWRRGYEPVHIDGPAPNRPRLRQGGVYVITGGLGGFGLTFGEMMARDFGAKLVLVGRSGLPDRATWDDVLASDDERAARRIRQVRELEALGGEVEVVAADITDRDDIARLLATTRERFGDLHGVIHAAGLPGGGMIQLKTAEMAEGVLAPKIEGTLALADALGDTPLDFFVLCSSTISVLGTFGQVDYCGANNFMDVFAESRVGHPSHTMSINWAAWQEVGMAVETVSAGSKPAKAAEEAKGDGAASEEPTSGGVSKSLHGPDNPPIPASATWQGIHPLLERQVSATEGEVVYATDFDVARHWVLDEHRIMGNPAIPGTTYLELARAAYCHFVSEDAGADARAELHDVFFFQPLMVDVGEPKEGRVILQPAAGGGYQFRIVSHASDGPDGQPVWMDHARGKVTPVSGASTKHDLAAIKARAKEEVDMQEGALAADGKLVYWGPRWQVLEKIWFLADDEGMAKLTLAEEFSPDLDAMGLHPALLDVATALTSALTEGDNYLPLSYHRVRVYGTLPRTFYSLVKFESGTKGGETVSANIRLLDEAGNELVVIERFAMKKVGAARERLAEGTKAGAIKAESSSKDEGMFAAGGMKPAEGAEALRRVLSRVRQPRVVVSPRPIEAMKAQMMASVAQFAEGGETAAKALAKGSEEVHPRPNLPTPYVEPSNELEETLAGIWQNVLGLDKVGINDNFFDLGGDSVLGITVISQTAEAGLALSPEYLFEYQTIAELAAVLAKEAEGGGEAAETAAEAEGEMGEDLDDDQLAAVLAQLDDL